MANAVHTVRVYSPTKYLRVFERNGFHEADVLCDMLGMRQHTISYRVSVDRDVKDDYRREESTSERDPTRLYRLTHILLPLIPDLDWSDNFGKYQNVALERIVRDLHDVAASVTLPDQQAVRDSNVHLAILKGDSLHHNLQTAIVTTLVTHQMCHRVGSSGGVGREYIHAALTAPDAILFLLFSSDDATARTIEPEVNGTTATRRPPTAASTAGNYQVKTASERFEESLTWKLPDDIQPLALAVVFNSDHHKQGRTGAPMDRPEPPTTARTTQPICFEHEWYVDILCARWIRNIGVYLLDVVFRPSRHGEV